MPSELQDEAVQIARKVMGNKEVEHEIASEISKAFNKKYFIPDLLICFVCICALVVGFDPNCPAASCKVRPHMALHRWSQFWVIRHSRDENFHLFLHWAEGDPAVQSWVTQLNEVVRIRLSCHPW